MPKPKNKTAQRGIVAAAATALVVGGSFIAPAVAADKAESIPAPSQSPSATPSATDVAVDTKGLEKAIARDLGQTGEEYQEAAKVTAKASALKAALREAGIEHNVTVEDGIAVAQVGKADLAAAKKIIASVEETESPEGEKEQTEASAEATDEAKESAKPVASAAPAKATKKAEAEKPNLAKVAPVKSSSPAVKLETKDVNSIDDVLTELQKTVTPSALKELTSVTVDEKVRSWFEPVEQEQLKPPSLQSLLHCGPTKVYPSRKLPVDSKV